MNILKESRREIIKIKAEIDKIQNTESAKPDIFLKRLIKLMNV